MIILEKDIEKEIKEKTKLSQQSKELANIIDKSNIELYIVDFETNKYVYVNNGALMNLGYTKDELLEMDIYDINPYLTRHRVKKLKKYELQSNLNYLTNTTKHKRKNGEIYTAQSFIHKITFNNKLAYVIYDIDITEKEKAEKELLHQKNLLAHQAYHDPLTNLPNRALFSDRLKQAIYKAHRNQGELALLFIDLDQFKQINDSLGHIVGDSVLKNISTRFSKILRKEDTLARLGGDEFTIIAENVKSYNGIATLAKKLITEVQKPITIDNHDLFITCSIGISLYPQNGQHVNILLRNADSAMYKAKESGRNTFNFYTKEMTKSAFERVTMETSLRHAINSDEFIVYFQPKFNALTNKIIGLETLARWSHPVAGLVPPSKFIPLAQENGMIVEIDEIISHKAMTKFLEFTNEMGEIGTLALNLTIKQLMHPAFIDSIKTKLLELNFNPKWLVY